MNKLDTKDITLDKAADVVKLATQMIKLQNEQISILKQAMEEEINESSDFKTRTKLQQAFNECANLEVKQ